MNPSSQLSPGGAWAMGSLFVIAGIVPILFGLGVITPSNPGPDTAPPWVMVCAGLMFVVAGLAIVVDYGIAGRFVGQMAPDGDFPPGTPMAIRAGNFMLGMTIVGCMTAVFGWVAFGPGPRHFSSAIDVPLLGVTAWGRSGEMTGRIAFGAATVLMALMFVACTVVGVERLWRARNDG
jgi:hypothetical protein